MQVTLRPRQDVVRSDLRDVSYDDASSGMQFAFALRITVKDASYFSPLGGS
jgi:hypothetical protein